MPRSGNNISRGMKKSFYILFFIIIGTAFFGINNVFSQVSPVSGYTALHDGKIFIPYSENLQKYFPSVLLPYKNAVVQAPTGSIPSGYQTTLPRGLSVNKLSGLLEGTPDLDGSFAFRLFLEDSQGNFGTIPFSINIAPATAPAPGTASAKPPNIISPASPITGTANQYLTIKFQATDGAPPYKWGGQGTLPPGLSFGKSGEKFNSEGILEGAPAFGGTYQVTITATDSKGKFGDKSYSFEIAGPPPPGTSGAGTGTGAGSTTGKLEIAWPDSPLRSKLNEKTDIPGLIKYIYDWGISLGGFAAFIALVIAGVQYLTSAGNAGKMKEAMDRIRSAGLGLVLLLGSVLILNTINPQLTKLKMPELPGNQEEWKIGFSLPKEEQGGDCKESTLYRDIKYTNPIMTLKGPENGVPILNETVKSVQSEGSCQLILYSLDNYRANSDNPPVVVSKEVRDMSAFGETFFRSVKMINLQY